MEKWLHFKIGIAKKSPNKARIMAVFKIKKQIRQIEMRWKNLSDPKLADTREQKDWCFWATIPIIKIKIRTAWSFVATKAWLNKEIRIKIHLAAIVMLIA